MNTHAGNTKEGMKLTGQVCNFGHRETRRYILPG